MSDKMIFKKTHDVNKALFADLLFAAKGDNRTMKDFALACGTYPSTFTRIVQQANKGASSLDLLRSIAANAALDSEVTFEALASANGYSMLQPSIYSLDGEVELVIGKMLVMKLLSMQHSASMTWKKYRIGTLSRSAFVPDFVISTDAFEKAYSTWCVDVYSIKHTEDLSWYQQDLLRRISDFQLVSANTNGIDPPPSRYLIVVVDKDLYNIIYELFQNIVVHANISVLFVNLSTRSIEAEFLLPHIDAGHREPLFMTPTPKYAAEELSNKEDTL